MGKCHTFDICLKLCLLYYCVFALKSGWAGQTCSSFDCAGVNGCYGNGMCIGPNKCNCSAGWSGNQCIIPICR